MATCPAELRPRDRYESFGPALVCGRWCPDSRGFCFYHDPERKPVRDERGRIVKKAAK